MSKLSYITTCKGRLTHLQQTLPRVVNQPDVACVVVDYACPDGAADWVEAHFPMVKVVRVFGVDGFNASHARNLGAQAADTPWLGFFDADILWSPTFSERVVPQLQSGFFYRGQPVTLQTWGSVICHRNDFAAIGGYDEAFFGWGGEDDDLLARLAMRGCAAVGFPGSLLDEIPHDDDARVRFHAVKDRRVQHRINMLYIQVKMDLLRLTGGPLAAELRATLFGEVRRNVIHSSSRGESVATIEVTLPKRLFNPPAVDRKSDGWHLNRKIIYSIDLTEQLSETT